MEKLLRPSVHAERIEEERAKQESRRLAKLKTRSLDLHYRPVADSIVKESEAEALRRRYPEAFSEDKNAEIIQVESLRRVANALTPKENSSRKPSQDERGDLQHDVLTREAPANKRLHRAGQRTIPPTRFGIKEDVGGTRARVRTILRGLAPEK